MTLMLSVIVCTYNRPFWLRNCLEALVSQCADASVVEVLIVDNNSTDATSSIAHEFTERLPNFKYIFEERQGLSWARNRGIWEARGKIVAYIDDDAKAHPDWVNAIIHFFEAWPDASGVGGQHNAFSLTPIPLWFPKEYGCRSLGNETRQLKQDEWISGTNMAFKKGALTEIGGFDTSIGMSGDKVSYGEETQLTQRMLARGMQIFYCAEMYVDHAILPNKLKLHWLLYSDFANGYDWVTTFNYKGGVSSFMPRLAHSVFRAVPLFLFSKEKYLKTRVYRSAVQLFWHVGVFVRLLGVKRKSSQKKDIS